VTVESRRAATVTAIAAPPVAAVATIYASARHSAVALAIAAAAVLSIFAADAALWARGQWASAAAALLLVAALVSFLISYRAAPLPAPAPFSGPLPAASPPEEMAVFRLPTGVHHRTASFGYRGGSFLEGRDFVMNAALVQHPRGDLLIDAGLSHAIDDQMRLIPLSVRLLTGNERQATAAEQLDANGYDRRRLAGILLTHAHWDHASGVLDFPDTPILITADEHHFVRDGGWITAIARSAGGERFVEYGFDSGPYLGYPSSHDVYGDGSIVVVPAAGHTPGSVIVFVVLPGGERYAFIGDLAWQLEGITEREEKPWFTRRVADVDPAAVREQILRLSAVVARFPSIIVVPSHDPRGYARMRTLAAAPEER
jgi:N-acyl homoserine lactone hydrolase